MKLQAAFLQFLPKPPLTPDQVELLKNDNVVSAAAREQGRTLEALGIIPNSVASIVPDYLWRFRKTGQFHGRIGVACRASSPRKRDLITSIHRRVDSETALRLVFERERDAGAKGRNLSILHFHVHLGDLGHAEIAQ